MNDKPKTKKVGDSTMSLDISFRAEKPIICPHCGKIADYKSVCESETSGGRIWHDFLTTVGGSLPYESPTDGDERYGEDYALTDNELKGLITFTELHSPYNAREVLKLCHMVAAHQKDGWRMVINADW